MIQKSNSRLFTDGPADGFLRARIVEMQRDVNDIPPQRFLDTTTVGVDPAEFVTKYTAHLPILDSSLNAIRKSNPQEVQLQVDDFGRRSMVTGARYQFYVPFSGDASFFRFHGSSFPMTSPRAHLDLRKNDLVISIDADDEEAKRIDEEFKAELRLAQGFLDGLAPVLQDYNQKLHTEATSAIERRRSSIKAAHDVADKLPYKSR